MERARRRDQIGPTLLMMATALLIAAAFPALGVGPPAKAAGPSAAACRAFDGWAVSMAAISRRASTASFRDLAQLTTLGESTGRRLEVQAATGARVALALPAESFVTRPVGNVLLYGGDLPGSGSEVHAVDLATGCDTTLARPVDIVRSAAIDPAGHRLYVHSVTRAGRRDAGVTRYDILTGESNEALAPLPDSEVFGPTFGTELRWSVDGSALAVQSCGVGICRTRILDTTTGRVESVDHGHGPIVGLTSRTLYAFEDLHGLPSAVLAFDRQSGLLTTLVDEAFDASLEPAGSAALLRIETAAGNLEVTQ